MSFRKLRKIFFASILVCLVVCAAGFIGLRHNIQSSLDDLCMLAQDTHPHPGDNVAALTDYLQSESHDLRERNHAIWALGQARDQRTLPILQGFCTGEKCDHDYILCQRELDKAIKLCKGQTPNIMMTKTSQSYKPSVN